MFTIKFYSNDGYRQIIREAESFTILRCPPGPDDDGSAEITLHQKNQSDDRRFDIGPEIENAYPPRFFKAIIENAAGKTTEIVVLQPRGARPLSAAA